MIRVRWFVRIVAIWLLLPGALAEAKTVLLLPVQGGWEETASAKHRAPAERLVREAAASQGLRVVEGPAAGILLEQLTVAGYERPELITAYRMGAELVGRPRLVPIDARADLRLEILDTATGRPVHDALIPVDDLEVARQKAERGWAAAIASPSGAPEAAAVALLPLRRANRRSDVTASQILPVLGLESFLHRQIAGIPGVRPADPSLAQFVHDEPRHVAGVLAGAPSPTVLRDPVVVRVDVRFPLLATPGVGLQAEPYVLAITVRRGGATEAFEVSGRVADAAALEAQAATRLRAAIARLAGLPEPNPVEIAEGDRLRIEARAALIDALLLARSAKRGDEAASRRVLDALTRATALMSDSAEPFEGAREILYYEDGVAGDDASRRLSALRRQAIERYPEAGAWSEWIVREYFQPRPRAVGQRVDPSAEEMLGVSRRLADAIIVGGTRMPDFLTDKPLAALMDAGEHQRAFNLCLAGMETAGLRGWVPFSSYATVAMERDQPVYALKAAEALSRYYPGYELQWLEIADRRPQRGAEARLGERITQGALSRWWQPVIERRGRRQAAQRRRAALDVVPGDMPPLVSSRPMEPAARQAVPSGYDLVGLMRGSDELYVARKQDAVLIGRLGNDQLVTVPRDVLTGRERDRDFPRPTFAWVGSTLYLAGGSGGLVSVDTVTGQARPVPIGPAPRAAVMDVHARDGRLFVAGESDGGGFVARLDDASADAWTCWRSPDAAGAVDFMTPSADGWRAYHARSGRVSELVLAEQKWTRSRAVSTYGTEPNRFAAGPGGVLMFDGNPLSWGAMWLLDERGGGVWPIEFAPSGVSHFAHDVERHKALWSPLPGERFAPTGGHPVDAVVDGQGVLWILDLAGCLTATRDGRHFLQPRKVIEFARSMQLSVDGAAVRVAGQREVVTIPVQKLADALAEPGAMVPSADFRATAAKVLAAWIESRPPLQQGWYFTQVDRAELAAAALLRAEADGTAEGAAVLAEQLMRAGRADDAAVAVRAYVADLSKLDLPMLETTYLDLLAAQEKWAELAATVERLWELSPLRGSDIPADERMGRWEWASRHSLPGERHEQALERVVQGQLPKAPWDWEGAPVYREMGRTLRRKAAGELAAALGRRGAFQRVYDHPLLGPAAWDEGTGGDGWELLAHAGRYDEAAAWIENEHDRRQLALLAGRWDEVLAQPVERVAHRESVELPQVLRASLYAGRWDAYDDAAARLRRSQDDADLRWSFVAWMRESDGGAPWQATTRWAQAEALEYRGEMGPARRQYEACAAAHPATLAGAESAMRMGELVWLGDGDAAGARAWFDRADAAYDGLARGGGSAGLRAWAHLRRGMIARLVREEGGDAREHFAAASRLDGPAGTLARAALAGDGVEAVAPMIAVGTSDRPAVSAVVDVPLDQREWVVVNKGNTAIQPQAHAYAPVAGTSRLFQWGERHDRWHLYLWYTFARYRPGLGWVYIRVGQGEQIVWCRLRTDRAR